MTEPPVRLFATYFDIARFTEGIDPTADQDAWHSRWQYIAMPRIAGDPAHVLFSRYQATPSHRSVWKGNPYVDLSSINDIVEQLLAGSPNIILREPIVVELDHASVRYSVPENLKGLKTPWSVINAAKKQARRLGYTV